MVFEDCFPEFSEYQFVVCVFALLMEGCKHLHGVYVLNLCTMKGLKGEHHGVHHR